jgi:hypothetical protein
LRGPWPAGTRGVSSLIGTLLRSFPLGARGVACGRLVLGCTLGACLLLFVFLLVFVLILVIIVVVTVLLELAPPTAPPSSTSVPRVTVAVGGPDHNWRREGGREGRSRESE